MCDLINLLKEATRYSIVWLFDINWYHNFNRPFPAIRKISQPFLHLQSTLRIWPLSFGPCGKSLESGFGQRRSCRRAGQGTSETTMERLGCTILNGWCPWFCGPKPRWNYGKDPPMFAQFLWDLGGTNAWTRPELGYQCRNSPAPGSIKSRTAHLTAEYAECKLSM